MSMKHLGERFDIHTGGNDHSSRTTRTSSPSRRAPSATRSCSIWVHGGFLQMDGQKMAKSAGNVYRVTDLADHGYRPARLSAPVLRGEVPQRDGLLVGGAGGPGPASRAPPADGGLGVGRGRARRGRRGGGVDRRFRDAIADDLDLPHAIGDLNELVGSDPETRREKHEQIRPGTRCSASTSIASSARVRSSPAGGPRPRPTPGTRHATEGLRGLRRDTGPSFTAMGYEVMDSAEGTEIRPRI